MSAIAQALTDKDFLTAQPDDQKAYLAHIDPDFAKASPEDQAAYHAAVVLPAVKQNSLKLNAQPTQFEKDRTSGPDRGFVSGLKESLPSGGSMMRRAVLGGFDPMSDIQTIQNLAKHHGAADIGGSLVGIDAEKMRERAEHADTAGIVGEATIPTLSAAAGLEHATGSPLTSLAGRGLTAIKPQLSTIADAATHPMQIPGKLLKAGVSMISEKPEFPGAPLPAAGDFYAHEGAERNAIRTKNEALNRQQAREAARQEKLQPIPTDTPTPISPGAHLPSANEFYAKEGAERNAILARGEGEKPAVAEFPGAHLPSMEDFYTKRGEELNAIRRRGINEPKPAAGEVGSAGTAPSPEVMHFPEPRALQPGDKPGSMYSIPRDELTGAAQRGAPGAGDVLRNINKPIIYTPREGVGYPGPRTEPPPTLPPTVTAAHQPEVIRMGTGVGAEGPQRIGVGQVGELSDRALDDRRLEMRAQRLQQEIGRQERPPSNADQRTNPQVSGREPRAPRAGQSASREPMTKAEQLKAARDVAATKRTGRIF
jgi:hypothetical protein